MADDTLAAGQFIQRYAGALCQRMARRQSSNQAVLVERNIRENLGIHQGQMRDDQIDDALIEAAEGYISVQMTV